MLSVTPRADSPSRRLEVSSFMRLKDLVKQENSKGPLGFAETEAWDGG